MTDNSVEWIGIREAARRIGISEETARRRADAGEFGELWWTMPDQRGQRRVSAAGVEAYRQRIRSADSG